MIEQLDNSTGRNLAYKVSGDISETDYKILVPEVTATIAEFGSTNLLFDLTDFRWEKIDAWKSDLSFGVEFHKKIDKMAIVGDKRYQKLIADVAAPFYSRQSKFFQDLQTAWAWMTE